jgi:peptide deformylase
MNAYLVSETILQHTPETPENSPLLNCCKPVPFSEILTPNFQEFLSQLYAKMQEYNGIGIAANQVGCPYQVFIIEYHGNNPRYSSIEIVPKQFFINPKIISFSTEKVCYYHGCLSAKGKGRGLVATYATITVSAYNESAQQFTRELTGLAAIIFQHEFNHLLGRTYLDSACTYVPLEELLAENAGKIPCYRVCEDQEAPDLIPIKLFP